MTAGDRIAASTLVAVEPAVAFEVFTVESDRWFARGARLNACE